MYIYYLSGCYVLSFYHYNYIAAINTDVYVLIYTLFKWTLVYSQYNYIAINNANISFIHLLFK